MGEVNFSPTIQLAWGWRHCWQLVVRKLSGGKVNLKCIKNLAKAVGIEKPLSVNLLQAQQHFRVADNAYRLLKPNAPMLHQDFLWERARDARLMDHQ